MLNRFYANSHVVLYLFIYCVVAILTLYLFVLPPILGDEGNYTISTMEMAVSHHYLMTTIFGQFYGRPPMLNWLMLPLAKLLGWDHILLASRLLTITCSVAIAVILGLFVKRQTKNSAFALLCVSILISGDFLMRRGWLAYSDTALTLFTFAAMICLWLAVIDRKFWLLLVGLVLLNCGFLCKALTPFGYYGILYLVLLWQHPNRKFLLRPAIIIVHIIAFSFPLFWNHLTTPQYGAMMMSDVLDVNQTLFHNIAGYFYQVLYYRPLEGLIHLAPASVIALYFMIKQRRPISNQQEFKSFAKIAFLTAAIIFIGCWIAPLATQARYYMPMYPFAAIALAFVIWHSGKTAEQVLQLSLIFYIIAALFLSLGGTRYYQHHFRFNFNDMGAQVLKVTAGYPVYVTGAHVDVIDSIVSTLDSHYMTKAEPLVYRAPQGWNNGFVVTGKYQPEMGQMVLMFRPKRVSKRVYLVCRGTACAAAAQKLGQPLPVTLVTKSPF